MLRKLHIAQGRRQILILGEIRYRLELEEACGSLVHDRIVLEGHSYGG